MGLHMQEIILRERHFARKGESEDEAFYSRFGRHEARNLSRAMAVKPSDGYDIIVSCSLVHVCNLLKS